MTNPSYSNAGLTIAPVTEDNVSVFMMLLRETMEEFFSEGSALSDAEERIRAAFFSSPPLLEAMVAYYHGEAAGMVCWSHFLSLLDGKLTMWMNDIYVRPTHRRHPVAMALLFYALALARSKDYGRVEGKVSESNTDLLRMYGVLQAEKLSHHLFRVDLAKADWSWLEGFQITPASQ